MAKMLLPSKKYLLQSPMGHTSLVNITNLFSSNKIPIISTFLTRYGAISPFINPPPSPKRSQIKNPTSIPNNLKLKPQTMELYPYYPPLHSTSPYPFFLPSPYFYSIPRNYVHWTQTPVSHVYTTDLPGVRKEEIRVEVEDGRYLVIRTDLGDDEEVSGEERRRSFMRKFRLPERVNVDEISAGFEDGVLTVRVPRRLVSRRPRVEDIIVDLAAEETRNSVARAA